MANTKISALTAASTLGGTEALAGVQSAANVKITPAQIKTYAESNPIALAPPSLTGSAATSSLAITQTWNTTGTPTALSVAVTDTASNASSLLANFTVGGASVASLTKAGTLNVGLASAFAPKIINIRSGSGVPQFQFNGTDCFGVATDGILLGAGALIFGAATSTQDVFLRRDAANTLALRNSTAAQTLRVYNTYTDASNYERGMFGYDTNVLYIGHKSAGTGSSARATVFVNYATGSWHWREDIGGTTYTRMTLTNETNPKLSLRGDGFFGWTGDGTNANAALTASVIRVADGIVGVRAASASAGAALNLLEQTAPAAPAANQVVIYAVDNGAGKTQLMALFASGAAQQLAIEP